MPEQYDEFMLMLAAAAVLLWDAGSAKDLARCKPIRSGDVGAEAVWQGDGHGAVSVSTTPRAVGRLELRCRIPVPSGVVVALELERALVSFAGAASRETGSGLTISAPGVEWSLTRVAGEDWIEAAHRRETLASRDAHVLLTIAVEDRSPGVPVRVDVRGLRLVRSE